MRRMTSRTPVVEPERGRQGYETEYEFFEAVNSKFDRLGVRKIHASYLPATTLPFGLTIFLPFTISLACVYRLN
jgi:hypothetical protein